MTIPSSVPILMYHSVSARGPGPVSVTPETFEDQMAVLRDAGAVGMSVSDYVAARTNHTVPEGAVVLTFDDGYRDFLDEAFSTLQAARWGCTVFLPVVPIDRAEPWDCGDSHRRELLTWRDVQDLSARNVEFGAHSMTHRDLTRMAPDIARAEIVDSGRRIADRTGRAVEGFAAPLGRITTDLLETVRKHYRWSVSTTLARASESADIFRLPRIEMWYFRNIPQWRKYVASGWTPYFAFRRAMRAVRELA